MSRKQLNLVNNFKQLDQLFICSSFLRTIDIVSFDVFDTLLYRRCSAEDIQLGVAIAINNHLYKIGLSNIDVLKMREQAFLNASAINESNGLDREAHFDAINMEWIKLLAPGEPAKWEELSKLARKAKIKYEHWACFPNPDISSILRKLKEHDKRLIFISDMYLGETIISEIFAANGLRQFFSYGYVSGDVALTKNTGRLFQYVLDKEKIEACRMLHIGDNPHADGRRAIEQGIKAIIVRERDIQVKRMRYDHNYAIQDRRWLGFNAASFASAASAQQIEPEFHTLGRDVLGPPFSAFIHGLSEYCMRIRPDAVYFLAREGLLLKDLYDQLISTLPLPLPSGGYLCASRLTAATAAMRGFGWREVTLRMTAHSITTVRGVMSTLQFEPDVLLELARSCGIYDLDTKINVTDSPAFARLIDHPQVQYQAKRIGQEARDSLIEYLDRRGFFKARRVVLVDVGWGGQIQEGLELALSKEPAPEIHGYYLGINKYAEERSRAGLSIRADIADVERYEWAGCSIFYFVMLFEISCRAHHGTTLGYKSGKPIFASKYSAEHIPELYDDARLALMQKGIREYMSYYAKYAYMTHISAVDAMTYARTLIARVLHFPMRNEINIFSSLTNVGNFGSIETTKIIKAPSLLRINYFLDDIKSSHWRQGAAAVMLGRYGALMLSIFQAPRISRNLPPQNNTNPVHSGTSTAPWNPFSPLPHDFESEVRNRSLVLLEQGIEESPRKIYRNPLTIFELAMLYLGHRATNVYLSVKKLDSFQADLLPLRTWLWREIYVRLPVHGRIGRLLRIIKRWITA